MNTTTDPSVGNESFFDLSQIGIDRDKSIMQNIKAIFYPDAFGQWGKLWNIIKFLWLIVFIAAIVIQWVMYIMNADAEDKVKTMHINIAYTFLGWILLFGATRVLWIGLDIGWDGWSSGLIERLDTSLAFQIFSGIRAAAFFTAVFLIGYYGRQMMSGMDDEEKLKTMKQWVLNIVIVLAFIKLVDYVYYIAQSPDLKSKATELIVEISKVLGYILWWFFMIMLIYYGFRLMFSGGNEETLTKVKNLLIAVLVITLVLFFFLLIIYQISLEFAG